MTAFKLIPLPIRMMMLDNATLFSQTGLSYCPCPRVTPDQRLQLLEQVNQLVDPLDRQEPLSLLSFGSGNMGLEYLVIQMLITKGFEDIAFTGIDYSYGVSREDLSKSLEALFVMTFSFFHNSSLSEDRVGALSLKLSRIVGQLSTLVMENDFTPIIPELFQQNIRSSFTGLIEDARQVDPVSEKDLFEGFLNDCHAQAALLKYLSTYYHYHSQVKITKTFQSIEGLSLELYNSLQEESGIILPDLILKVDTPDCSEFLSYTSFATQHLEYPLSIINLDERGLSCETIQPAKRRRIEICTAKAA